MRYVSIVVLLLGYMFAYTQPKIHIEGNDVYDWGKIDPKGKPLTAKVKIFNQGTDTLKISEVKPTCGCTTAPLDKNNIEPYGYATLDITLTVSDDGPIHKSIGITSNDTKTPTKNLSLKADIVRPIGLSPRFLSFSNMELNKVTIAKSVITNNTNKTIRIKDVVAEPKELAINIKKNTKILPNKTIMLEVRFTPRTLSFLSGKVTLKTDVKDMEDVEISVAGNMAPAKNK
jgi:hypothetical protein